MDRLPGICTAENHYLSEGFWGYDMGRARVAPADVQGSRAPGCGDDGCGLILRPNCYKVPHIKR